MGVKNMTHWLHYHGWSGVEERRLKHPRMPFDRCSRDQPWPSSMNIGDTIWGFTRNDGEYFITGSMVVQWMGLSEDIPEYITSDTLFNYKEYSAGCPTNMATEYKAILSEELRFAFLPKYKGGCELKDVSTIELRGFLQELDEEFVNEQLL